MENEKKKLRAQIEFARDCIDEIPHLAASYKDIAFKVILESLIHHPQTKTPEIHQEISTQAPLANVQTVATLIRKLKPKSHSDKVLAIAYFLHKVRQLQSITRKDIENEYENALLPKSKNFSVEIKFNIKRGYLMSTSKGDSGYTITNEGIEYIESKMVNDNG